MSPSHNLRLLITILFSLGTCATAIAQEEALDAGAPTNTNAVITPPSDSTVPQTTAGSPPEHAKQSAPAKNANLPPEKPHHISAEVCKNCHTKIYEQWHRSMHGQSTAVQDPIHGGFYRFVIGSPHQEGVKTKKGKYPVCLNCHAPNAALDKKTDLTARAAYSEGVSCVSCHLMKKYHGLEGPDGKLRYGVSTYDFSNSALQGSSGKNYTTNPTAANDSDPSFHPIPLEGNSMFRTSQACLGCHDRRVNFKGAPLCATGNEYQKFSTFIACQSCHMPKVDGVTDHSLAGGHGNDTVLDTLFMRLEAESEDDLITAKLHLHNQLPHSYPTGAPFRNFYIKLTALDATGKVVWKNFEKHPMKEDPKSMFVVVLGDKDNKPAPPPKATHILRDTRLEPNEKRVVKYELPAGNVVKLRAEALYNLVLPPQIDMLNKMAQDVPDLPSIAKDLFKPKRVAFSEVKL